jgi:heptosyltransferase-2
MMRIEADRILVRGPNWVGDAVMSSPGLRALRAGYPDARITLQLRPGLEALFEGSPLVDEVIPVRSYHRGLRALLGEGRELRSRRFDLGVCLPESFSSALLMRAAGVRCITGYAGGLRAPLFHRPVAVPVEWGRRRLVARERFVLGLTAALGCQEQGTQLQLSTSADEEAAARAALAKHGVEPADRLVVLAPGAAYGPSKRWSTASFAQLADALALRGARVVLLGSASERGLAGRIAAEAVQPVVDLVGEVDLGAAKSLLRRADLLVCNDAGARHIAVSFGVPCLVFFGPTAVEKTNLNLESVEVLETAVACRPCYLRECPIDHRCLTHITPERVIELAYRVLDAAA